VEHCEISRFGCGGDDQVHWFCVTVKTGFSHFNRHLKRPIHDVWRDWDIKHQTAPPRDAFNFVGTVAIGHFEIHGSAGPYRIV
jgi:hypothetical protein